MAHQEILEKNPTLLILVSNPKVTLDTLRKLQIKHSKKKEEGRTDLIAYSYDTDKAISVEIELAAEIASHPEAARKNMVKWPKKGFAAYHGWATTNRLKEIRESQIEQKEKENVLVFVV